MWPTPCQKMDHGYSWGLRGLDGMSPMWNESAHTLVDGFVGSELSKISSAGEEGEGGVGMLDARSGLKHRPVYKIPHHTGLKSGRRGILKDHRSSCEQERLHKYLLIILACWLTRSLPLPSYLINYCALVSATDEYTHHSVHVTQPYTGTTADNQLAPRQN